MRASRGAFRIQVIAMKGFFVKFPLLVSLLAFGPGAQAEAVGLVNDSRNLSFYHTHTGKTLDVVLSEDVDSVAAEIAGNWAVTGGLTVNSATLLSSKEVVRLVLDAVAIPGDVTASASNVQDLAGNVMTMTK